MKTVLQIITFAFALIACKWAFADVVRTDVTATAQVQTAYTAGSTEDYGTTKSSGPNWSMCRAWVTCENGQELSCGTRGVFMASCYAQKAKSVHCSADEGEGRQDIYCK